MLLDPRWSCPSPIRQMPEHLQRVIEKITAQVDGTEKLQRLSRLSFRPFGSFVAEPLSATYPVRSPSGAALLWLTLLPLSCREGCRIGKAA